MAGSDQELEVKFYLSRRADLERKLSDLGARLSAARVHEINMRLDTADQGLTSSGRLLRLRQDTHAHVTYKGTGSIKGGARLRQELEFTVSNFDTARALFEELGYHVYMMYEKYRTTYQLGDVSVSVDEMPYGDFTEIEGPDGETILQAAHQLNLDWDTRILDSYTVLFEQARGVLGFTFRDLSFENFKGWKVTPIDLGVKIADQP